MAGAHDGEQRKVLIAGATGVIGSAALALFTSLPDWQAVGLARRPSAAGQSGAIEGVDLTDARAVAALCGRLTDVTHVVYAAVQEAPGLAPGWVDKDRMHANLQMLRNLLEPLTAVAPRLAHVSILQGGKAYGWHIGKPHALPAREQDPRVVHDNFYFLQEDYLRETQSAGGWNWTILRPMVVFGDAVGVNMNPVLPIGAYAALQRQAGEPLHFPGGVTGVSQAADADLVAEALVWAANAPEAANEVFNVTNGDVFNWRQIWPTIADAFDMVAGAPRPTSLAGELLQRRDEWAALVKRHQLQAPADIELFLGQSAVYADQLLGRERIADPSLPAMMSTIKIRQAGFASCIDSAEMLTKWFRRLQRQRLLP